MKTVILYSSTHGTTENIAAQLLKKLDGEVEITPIKKGDKGRIDLSNYDRIIIGTSIHMGKIPRAVTEFFQNYESQLLEKPLGLYLCCMYEGEKAKEQLNANFPAVLRNHACAIALMGGELNIEKMNLIEKTIIKKIVGIDQTISKIDQDAIQNFAEQIKENKARKKSRPS